MAVDMVFSVFMVLILSQGSGFLLPKNSSNGDHFYLMGLLKNVNEMEQFILQLNNEVKSIQKQLASQNSSSPPDMTNLQIEFRTFQIKVKQELSEVKGAYNTSKQKNDALSNELLQVRQQLQELKNENALLKMRNGSLQCDAINRTVIMTACGTTGFVTQYSKVKFQNIKTVYGVSNMAAFRSSGNFTCEIAGVYLFSVFIMSNADPSEYTMYKNNDVIAAVHFNKGSNNFHTGTGILAVSLNVGDTLFVQVQYAMIVYGAESCMTVIKIR